MRRIITFILLPLLLFSSADVFGESLSLPTNRVYYVDNSYSMKLNSLWGPVKSNLINAISKVSNENDLITVAFFSDQSLELPVKTVKANKEGVAEIQRFIEKQNYVSSSLNTHHYIPFSDFVSKRVKQGYVNIMFVLTDGGDEYFKDNVQSGNNVLKKSWKGLLTPNSHVFGFYVDLNESRTATAQRLEFKGKELPWSMFETGASSHLYIVDGADLDINLIRFDDDFQDIDIRKTNRLRIKYSGYIKSKNDIVLEQSNPNFDISVESLDGDAVVLALSPVENNKPLPDNSDIKLKFSLRKMNGKATNDVGSKRMSFLASDRADDLVTVRFIDEKNKYATVNTDSNDDICIFHYDSFLWKKQHTDTVFRTISAEFSDMAKEASCSIQFRLVANSDAIVILDEGNCPIDRIVISPDCENNIVKISTSSDCRYPIEADVRLEFERYNGLDYIIFDNDTIKQPIGVDTLRNYRIRALSTTNPLVWWLLIIVSLPFLIFCGLKLYQWIIRITKPKFPGGNITLQFDTPAKDNNICNFSLLKAGNKGSEFGIISEDRGSSVNINKLAHECVDKVVLLNSGSERPADESPHKCNGYVFYISTDLKNAKLGNVPIEKIEISPLRNKHIGVEIHSVDRCIKRFKLDAKELVNPQIEEVSDSKHTLFVDPKKIRNNNPI